MKKLILHGGIHKTGSSSLQNWLDHNRDILAENKVGLLHAGAKNVCHHELAEALMSDTPEADDLIEEVVRELRQTENDVVIITSEVFDRLTRPAIQRLREVLEKVGGAFEVSVLFYLRPQAALLASRYNQQVKAGLVRLTFPEFVKDRLARRLPWLYFSDLLSPWEEVLGPKVLHARAAEKPFLVNGSVVDDFLSFFGYSDLLNRRPSTRSYNLSLNADVISAFRDILQREDVWSVPFRKRNPVFLRVAKWLENNVPEAAGKIQVHDAILEECRQKFAEDNDWVSDKFFSGRNVIEEAYDVMAVGKREPEDEGVSREQLAARVRQKLLGELRDEGLIDGAY